jgi:hypothetical protein
VFGWVGVGRDVNLITNSQKSLSLEAQFFPIYLANFLVGQLRTAARASQLTKSSSTSNSSDSHTVLHTL